MTRVASIPVTSLALYWRSGEPPMDRRVSHIRVLDVAAIDSVNLDQRVFE